uniref:Uncharacterized protein n=1 Tax=Rhizophora mucronata TaxID=61149 RepID=A0A2P2JNC2_RHIMU
MLDLYSNWFPTLYSFCAQRQISLRAISSSELLQLNLFPR